MINIVPLQKSDIESFNPLWDAEGKYHFELDSTYYKKGIPAKEFIQEALKEENLRIFVAKSEGNLVGFIMFEIGKADYSDTNIDEFGEILELYVSPEARGKGVGGKLMETAEKFFYEKGIRWSKLYCSSYNDNALKFYEDVGYEDRQSVLFKSIK